MYMCDNVHTYAAIYTHIHQLDPPYPTVTIWRVMKVLINRNQTTMLLCNH